ncbi:hypothetical protein [Cellulomonas sp. SG140]|uniref:hypothetical protein n=1 Tax=Cellulomonas sp. SG140 TaxID=2976536 RepID=UPI0021E718E9|nr:hypothetical protein [Cellulomonas sp. SG140]
MTASTATPPGEIRAADPLEPLEQALLRRAAADADAARAEAELSARTQTAAARAQAAEVLDRARAAGEADAERRQALDLARARREAQHIVLAAQRAAYEQLCTAARAAVQELLAEPGRQARLGALVVDRLGTEVRLEPHPSGGVVGVAADGRRVDASVDALVAHALARLDLAALWDDR